MNSPFRCCSQKVEVGCRISWGGPERWRGNWFGLHQNRKCDTSQPSKNQKCDSEVFNLVETEDLHAPVHYMILLLMLIFF